MTSDDLDSKKDNISDLADTDTNKIENKNTETINTDKDKSITDIRILLGTDLRTGRKYYWEFGNKELNNRHLLINGNSGCGKTYCIQGLLMSVALQGISSVVFDYTSGFTNSKLNSVFKKILAY